MVDVGRADSIDSFSWGLSQPAIGHVLKRAVPFFKLPSTPNHRGMML